MVLEENESYFYFKSNTIINQSESIIADHSRKKSSREQNP